MPHVAPPDARAVCLRSATAAELILVSDSGLINVCASPAVSAAASASQLQRPGLHHCRYARFLFFARAQRSNSAQSRCAGQEVWYGNKIMHLVHFQNNKQIIIKKTLIEKDCISLYNTTIPHTYHYQKTPKG